MQQGYSPFKIAAFFIRKAHESGVEITPMKLIKLVYIAHAWNLALLKRPLISEAVQAWKYGPVIESLYQGFKRFSNSPIPKNEMDSLPRPDDIDEQSKALLEKVWQEYGGLTGIHLSSLTHQPGTPWHTIWEGGGKHTKCAEIPNEQIEQYYALKSATQSGSGH
jgi:uncharacterized phage-associated protein